MTEVIYFLGAPVIVALCLWRWLRRDQRLQGTWRSNKEETLARWKEEATFPPSSIARLEPLLGNTTVVFAGGKVTTTAEHWTEVSRCRLVKSGKDYVVVEQFSKVHNRHLRFVVFFVDDGFWSASDDIIKGYIEKFDRIG